MRSLRSASRTSPRSLDSHETGLTRGVQVGNARLERLAGGHSSADAVRGCDAGPGGIGARLLRR